MVPILIPLTGHPTLSSQLPIRAFPGNQRRFVPTTSIGMPTSDGLTVRISNLPPETDSRGNDVRRFFDSRVGPSGTVISKNGIGHVVTQAKRRTKQTTVTFISHDFKKKALEKCDRTAFSAEHGNGSVVVDVEDEFMGLTTLYMPESGIPNIE